MLADAVTPAPRWRAAPLPDSVARLVTSGIGPRTAALLARRGVSDASEARAFLNPDLDQLHDPKQLPGVEQAVDRLQIARQAKQRTAIVGDYDVDGVSATALLTAVLQACGLDVEPILPLRLEEGYGFQPVHVERAASAGCRLIVTADCGSTAAEAARAALERGIDVIVTDHHLGSRAELPQGVIEINPHRSGSPYPFPDLSGVGVAYKLCTALADSVGRRIDAAALLRVVCLGTICDLVPLLGENRVFAARGLEALGESRSPGLRALMEKAGVRAPVDAVDVGFRIGPRLNAAGRLGSPRPALDLLMTRDEAEARSLAENLDRWNRERQAEEAVVVAEAEREFATMQSLPPILVAWRDSWHPGVLGIAAGRLSRTFHRPAVLLHIDGEVAKGSGRSVRQVHLFDFLDQWRDDYLRFGGHSQAVGLSVARRDLETLRERWTRAAESTWPPDWLRRTFDYELELSAEEIDSELLAELEQLAPFGVSNRQPLARIGPLEGSGNVRRFGRGHLKALARGEDGAAVELLGWGWQDREEDLEGLFEVLATIERDRYHGRPVLRLVDARPWQGSAAEDSTSDLRSDA